MTAQRMAMTAALAVALVATAASSARAQVGGVGRSSGKTVFAPYGSS